MFRIVENDGAVRQAAAERVIMVIAHLALRYPGATVKIDSPLSSPE